MTSPLTVTETNRLIRAGKALLVAGDAAALAQLQRGRWIGGTIPYFLTNQGGMVDQQRVMVAELPAAVLETDIRFVEAADLAKLPSTAFEYGFSIVIIPALSDAHSRYATEIYDVPGLFERPVAGWIAGVHLDDLGRQRPQVFNGQTGEASAEHMVVLHARLPETLTATIGIINPFEQGSGDRIRFAQTGFAADACRINDEPASFFDYVRQRQLDLRLPLVADQSGEMINVSFQSLDEAGHCVRFYAPVLSGVEYRQAAPLGDYRGRMLALLAQHQAEPLFACNCILNYLYAELEGDRPIAIAGPATFGEIAYVLLNQTQVCLQLEQRAL